MKRRKTLLAAAIEREDWDAAAVVLLLGVVEAAPKLPSESLEEMINILAEKHPHRAHARKPRRAH